MSSDSKREEIVRRVAKELQWQKKMRIQYDKLPETCFMCGVKPFAHLTPCDCCNHYFCIDCKNRFDELRPILLERKLTKENDELGCCKKISAVPQINFFCLCNTSLRCNILDINDAPVHFTGDEQRIYADFELKKIIKVIDEKKPPMGNDSSKRS